MSSGPDTSTFGFEAQNQIRGPAFSILLVVQTLIIIFGLLSNSLVIYLVLSNIRLRNVRNAFMLNLTISNLLLITICTPSFLISLVFKSWHLGNLGCKLIHSVQITIILMSAFSIMMIAIDRWMCVCFATSRQLNKREAWIIIIGLWILAICLSTPTFSHRTTTRFLDDSLLSKLKDFAMDQTLSSTTPLDETLTLSSSIPAGYDEQSNNVISSAASSSSSSSPSLTSTQVAPINFDSMKLFYMANMRNVEYCVESWEVLEHKRVYILVLFVLEFFLPCLTMLVTYIWIIRFLKAQDDRMNHYEMLRKRLLRNEKRHQKNCKLLSALCLTFIICCLPLSIFNIKADFDLGRHETTKNGKDVYWPLIVLTVLEEINTLITPLLYGWMNHNFRNEIYTKAKEIRARYSQVVQKKESFQLKTTLGNESNTVSGFRETMIVLDNSI